MPSSRHQCRRSISRSLRVSLVYYRKACLLIAPTGVTCTCYSAYSGGPCSPGRLMFAARLLLRLQPYQSRNPANSHQSLCCSGVAALADRLQPPPDEPESVTTVLSLTALAKTWGSGADSGADSDSDSGSGSGSGPGSGAGSEPLTKYSCAPRSGPAP